MNKLSTNQHKEKIYNLLSSFYDKLFFVLKPGHSQAGRYLTNEKTKQVLEVGVGTGLTFEHYAAGTNITAVDLSQGMLSKAEQKVADFPQLKIQLQVMDAQKLEFADNQFECSYAPSLLSVVPQPQKLISEMIRVTRPGGKIIIISHFEGNRSQDQLASRLLGPLTQRLFGFRMDLKTQLIEKTEGAQLVFKKKVNPVGPYHLSHLVVLEKLPVEKKKSSER